MNARRIFLIVITAGLIIGFGRVSTCAQTPPPTTAPPFFEFFAPAREAAEVYIPESVQTKGHWSTGYSGYIVENYIVVSFYVPATVTIEELGWQEDPATVLENTGYLALGVFHELEFRYSVLTENIILKKATDRVFPTLPDITLGGIPYERPPPWARTIAAIAIAGILFIAFLVIMRRRSRNVPP